MANKFRLLRGRHGRWENGKSVSYDPTENPIIHNLTYGELNGSLKDRVRLISGELPRPGQVFTPPAPPEDLPPAPPPNPYTSVLNDLNVGDAAEFIEGLNSIDELELLVAAEVAGKNRKGVLDAATTRKVELIKEE